MHGAAGTLFLRWRPLLDGILFGAFGPYGMDGSRTERSEMSTRIARWVQAPEQENLWKSRPIKGEVGILFVPESQLFTYAQQHSTQFFSDCYEGAYRGFHDNNIQADFAHIDEIDQWRFLYLPYPVMLKSETAARIKSWVAAGGTLICEGCPGYWGDRAHVGERQPNLGLDELFGAHESYVEFTPDLLDDVSLRVLGAFTWGGIYLQSYEPTTGRAVGWYDDGRIAAVKNSFGEGKTLLIGTMPGRGYTVHSGEGCAEFFRTIFALCGRDQFVKTSDDRIRARIHDGDGGTYLWIANPKRFDIPVLVTVSDRWHVRSIRTLWGAEAEKKGNVLSLVAPRRDVTVVQLM
jgi:beta-galactosidase